MNLRNVFSNQKTTVSIELHHEALGNLDISSQQLWIFISLSLCIPVVCALSVVSFSVPLCTNHLCPSLLLLSLFHAFFLFIFCFELCLFILSSFISYFLVSGSLPHQQGGPRLMSLQLCQVIALDTTGTSVFFLVCKGPLWQPQCVLRITVPWSKLVSTCLVLLEQ